MAHEGTIEPDMLATSLSKLPPPVMQMKSPLDSVPNYEALMNEAYPQEKVQQQQQQHVQPQQYQPLLPPPAQQTYYEQPPPQQQYQQFPPHHQQPQYDDYSPQPDPSQYYVARTPQPAILSIDFFKSKKLWTLTALIFVLVLWGIPKIKQMLPSVVSPLDGRLTLPGLAGISIVSALSYTLASETILR